jgi:hypothetical protein
LREVNLRFDQVNIVVPDVAAAAGFLRALGADLQDMPDEWAEWAAHHVGFPAVADGFDADLDSPTYASHWGGLPGDFAGVVINLRTEDRRSVDATFERALTLEGEALRAPYDAFWGARYSVVQGPGPIVVGIMSPADPESRGQPPKVSDFA